MRARRRWLALAGLIRLSSDRFSRYGLRLRCLDVRSVAVLPLQNTQSDPARFSARALADEIATRIDPQPRLQVRPLAARGSPRARVDLAGGRAELQVETVVTGRYLEEANGCT